MHVVVQEEWRLQPGSRPLLAAVVLCFFLLGGWLVGHSQDWLGHSLSPVSTPEHLGALTLTRLP